MFLKTNDTQVGRSPDDPAMEESDRPIIKPFIRDNVAQSDKVPTAVRDIGLEIRRYSADEARARDDLRKSPVV